MKDMLAGINNSGKAAKTIWEGVVGRIPKDDFTKAYNKWVERWDKCIEREGDYVEK